MRLRSSVLCLGLLWAGVAGAQTTQRVPLPLTVDRDPMPSPDPDPVVGVAPADGGKTVSDVAKGANGRYTVTQDAFEVRLNASVIDQTGKTIQTLTQDSFHVYEDGVPQVINSFRHEDLAVSIGLLIDNSGSMYDKLQAVEKAAIDLVKLSNPKDEEFLVDFANESMLDQEFTSSVDKLQQGLSYIEPKGGTAAYDALVASADYLTKNAKNTKQVLIIITDGEDNASSATLEQAIRRIQDLDGPEIYCIGLLFGEEIDKRESRHARKVLETIAQQTGGEAYFPKSVKEVDAIAAEVAGRYPVAVHDFVPVYEPAEQGWVPAGACGGEGEGVRAAGCADAEWVFSPDDGGWGGGDEVAGGGGPGAAGKRRFLRE